jgi:UDP-glucuronate decarboxylase
MRILVLGGAGFLGSHLVDKLIELEHQVTVIDDLCTGRWSNIKSDHNNPNLVCLPFDIRTCIIDIFNDPYDIIYNFACPASPVHYQADPIKTLTTSTIGVQRFVKYAQKMGSTFIQSSTSEVYGDPSVSPQTETYWGNVNTVGIRSCYDESKRISETILHDYNRVYGTKVKIVRIFNTYGPRMQINDGRVVSNFIVQALKGENITIYGDGSQTRSFCYVDDLIRGFIDVLNTPDTFIGPMNLGNDGEFTIFELACKVIEKTGFKSKIEYQPLPSDDPTKRKPDLTLARKMINYDAKIQLDEGLDNTIEYFRKELGL